MSLQYTTLPHCKMLHPVQTHWLPSTQNYYKVHVMMVTSCRACKKPLYGWFGILHNASRGPVHTMKDREIKAWLLRLKEFILQPDEEMGQVVSDYTHLISDDTGEVYHRVLYRLNPA